MPPNPFDPPLSRQTSIVILTRRYNEACGDHRIVTSLSTRSSTEVLEVNSSTGALQLATDRNTFPDEASAISTLTRQGFVQVNEAHALLGYVATQSLAGVLIATKISLKTILPGGHLVFLVSEAQWELLSLDAASHPFTVASEQEFWRSLQQHTISGVHFYCETADLTRPFPSVSLPARPVPEFRWNAWLAQPLVALGLTSHCPVLLQGAVESSDLVHPTGQRYTMTLISRRSRRHPGTRYIARGLNELAGPGNEIEAELILWKPANIVSLLGTTHIGDDQEKSVEWARVMWRRGTVPIWWGVEIESLNTRLQAEVYVRDWGPYVGMLTYFRALQRLLVQPSESSSLQANGSVDVDSATSSSKQHFQGDEKPLPYHTITCVNLLHCNPKKAAELMLSSHFQEGMRHVRERMSRSAGSATNSPNSSVTSNYAGKHTPPGSPSPLPPPKLLNFDWHGNMAMLSEERGIEAFWHFIKEPIQQCGIATGLLEPANDKAHNSDETNDLITPWGLNSNFHMRHTRQQKGILRFNCADSLDRTNAASCFAMLPALQEGLRLLGIPLDVISAPAAALVSTNTPIRTARGSAYGSSSSVTSRENTGTVVMDEEVEEVLPEGWERRQHAGRAVYIDHVNRTTQWEAPLGTVKRSKSTTMVSNSTAAPQTLATNTAISTAVNKISKTNPPWAFFNLGSLDDVRSRLYSEALSDYVSMFRRHGDVHSSLYTGSAAMHSHVLNLILSAEARGPYSASASVGKLQNLRVAVQRRWNNSISDFARQQSMELFLGLYVNKHCPGLELAVEEQRQPLEDLKGVDADDRFDKREAVHQGAELNALHLRKHDGRIGLREDPSNLEPDPLLTGIQQRNDDSGESEGSRGSGRNGTGPLDPLGVLGARTHSDNEEEEVTVENPIAAFGGLKI